MEGQDYGTQEVNERRPGGQMGGPHAAPVPGRMGLSQSALVAPIASILRDRDLKTPIKKVPRRFSRGEPPHKRNQKTEIRRLKIGGGKLWRSPAGEVSFFSIDISTVSMMKRSSPPLDYGFVEVTYVSILSLELH